MSKKVFFIFFLIFSKLNAQDKFGVIAGLNYTGFSNGIGKDLYLETSFGLQIGAFYEKPLNQKISFRPKLVFSQQGDRTETSWGGFGSPELNQIDYKLNYINIPLDFKFWNKIYVVAGPQIGFLISEKRGNVNIGDPSSVDFGVNLGTGFTINKMFFEWGLYQGLTDVASYQYSTGSTVNVRNATAKFTLGYKF